MRGSIVKNLEDVLEAIKQNGAYQVMCCYGEGVGCDDSGVKDRHVRIIWYPVGCLGEVRCMWHGKISDARDFDFCTAKPMRVSNPPMKEEIDGNGYWAWGASLIDKFMERFDAK